MSKQKRDTCNNEPFQLICPSIEELSTIKNQVKCKECNHIFSNESSFRLHDFKVHKKTNLTKKENIHYHCPIENCIYAVGNQKHFSVHKYLKQHFLKVHAEKKFPCIHCTKGFSTNAAKEAHIQVCGKEFTCECQKKFNSYEALLTHAKRHSHAVDKKHNSNKSKWDKLKKIVIDIQPEVFKYQSSKFKLIPILPQPKCDVSIQTDESMIQVKMKKNVKSKNSFNKICRQTQTNDNLREKKSKKSTQTQTLKSVSQIIRVRQVKKRKKNFSSPEPTTDDSTMNKMNVPKYVLPESPLIMSHDIILQDLWEEKNESGTQTSPEKYMFSDLEDSLQNTTYHGISRSDPMLTEEFYSDKFSSIETQTEKEICQSIFESDSLNSPNKIQTTENFTETMEPLHFYSNTCTQTCDEILSSDFGLSDIQTQTAWESIDESTVSTETQTKAIKCLSGCDSSSWFTIETNHMETQTDLLSIFQDLE